MIVENHFRSSSLLLEMISCEDLKKEERASSTFCLPMAARMSSPQSKFSTLEIAKGFLEPILQPNLRMKQDKSGYAYEKKKSLTLRSLIWFMVVLESFLVSKSTSGLIASDKWSGMLRTPTLRWEKESSNGFMSIFILNRMICLFFHKC